MDLGASCLVSISLEIIVNLYGKDQMHVVE